MLYINDLIFKNQLFEACSKKYFEETKFHRETELNPHLGGQGGQEHTRTQTHSPHGKFRSENV
jgi:hypothetical protein